MSRFLISSSLVLVLAPPTLAGPVDFVRDVRPILQKHCYACHGEKRQRSGLRPTDISEEQWQRFPPYLAGFKQGGPEEG